MEVTKLVGSSPAVQALQEEIYYASRCDAKVRSPARVVRAKRSLPG